MTLTYCNMYYDKSHADIVTMTEQKHQEQYHCKWFVYYDVWACVDMHKTQKIKKKHIYVKIGSGIK